MSEPPLHLLQHLASKQEQVRFMVGGNKNEYFVPHDLLNDAYHFCEQEERPKTYERLTDAQRSAIAALKEALDVGGDFDQYDHAGLATLVEHDPAWSLIRQRAGEVLMSYGSIVPA